MTNNKKHVIPKTKYGRKRREYFHNEEREQRVQLEQKAEEERAEKAEQLAKNNEERVKDNLRKARIEKLTQEEIQQQQILAISRKHSPSDNDINASPSDEAYKLDDNKENQDVHSEQHNIDKQKVEQSTTEQSKNDVETNRKETSHVNGNGIIGKNEQDDHFYSEEAQQSRVKQYIDEESGSNSKEKVENTQKNNNIETHHKQSNIDKIREFFLEHWAKLLIVIGVILLLVLINAIFNNVDHNGSSRESVFKGHQDKAYTTTMKSANSAIHSIVTVDNNTGKETSSADKETQEAGKENELGSGVVYKKVGGSIFIMTNAHVVGDKKEQKITYGNDDYSIGKVIGTDKFSDIAIVKAKVKSDSDVKPIKMGDSSTLVLGEPIIVIGNPLGVDFKGSVSEGIISGLNRHVPVDIDKDNQYDVLMSAFQVDAPVNPGNSGGGVIDRDGKLVGIASLKIDMENVEGMAFAIPVNDAQSIAKQLEAKGEVKYPNTGVKITNVAEIDDATRQAISLPNDINKGILIGDVKENSLGEKSGLQKNDVIVELDGKEIEDNLRYRQVIFSHKDDLQTLPAKIYRDGKLKDIKIKLK